MGDIPYLTSTQPTSNLNFGSAIVGDVDLDDDGVPDIIGATSVRLCESIENKTLIGKIIALR